MPLVLLARDHFKRGDYGYTDRDGVYRLRTGATVLDAVIVIALRDVSALELGEFEEAQPATDPAH